MTISPNAVHIALARQIAAEHCASLIECHGVAIRDRIGRILWYSLDLNDAYSGSDLRRALQYLEAEGMLRRHPKCDAVKVVWP